MTDSEYMKTLWTVDKIRMRVDYETSDEESFRMFNGDGKDIYNHKSINLILSFQDIQICYAKELNIVTEILNTEDIDDFMKLLDIHEIELNTIKQSDMNHPVDIFNLYKRLSIFWKEAQQILKNENLRRLLGESYFSNSIYLIKVEKNNKSLSF